MPERIQKLLDQIKEWWQKFTSRQKAIMISAAAVVVVALIILGVVLTRPEYLILRVANDAKEAQSIQELLQSNPDITWEQSDDGMTFRVLKKDYGTASILLGTNNISTDGYTINDALNGSFSTTEADTQKKYQLYLEKKYEDVLKSLENVSNADVNLYIPNDDGTIIANQQESSASVKLDLAGSMSRSQAKSIAQYMATTLGNKTLNNITIIDNAGNTLFSGNEEDSAAGVATANQEIKQNAEQAMADKVKKVFESGDTQSVFDNVTVGVNLTMDFSQESSVDYRYYVEDGRSEGYKDSETTKKTESTGGVQGVPGTDSNDDTTYVIQDNNYSHSKSSEVTTDYLPNETITNKTGEQGKTDLTTSSISIVATNAVTYNEDVLKANGTLDNMTFDEYRAQNSNRVQQDVDPTIITAVSQATGIPEANISIIAYDVPYFEYSKNQRSLTDYLQIIIALLVFLLLGFVVFRSLRRDEEEDVEQEVTVDQLLENQPDEELEDIGFNEKSEARILIEKFVDEKPEAVANLLRNWLNEDWS